MNATDNAVLLGRSRLTTPKLLTNVVVSNVTEAPLYFRRKKSPLSNHWKRQGASPPVSQPNHNGERRMKPYEHVALASEFVAFAQPLPAVRFKSNDRQQYQLAIVA